MTRQTPVANILIDALMTLLFAVSTGFAVWQAIRGNAEWAGLDAGMAALSFTSRRIGK